VNNNMAFVPVAAGPRAGACAASLGALPPLGVLAAVSTTDRREMAPSRATAGAARQRLRKASVKPSLHVALGQRMSAQTYLHAIGAATNGGGQTGSLPAWDPV
jgi:hypothetical protein